MGRVGNRRISQLEGFSVEISKASGDENVREMCLYLDFKTERGVRMPLPDSNLELGRIDSQ